MTSASKCSNIFLTNRALRASSLIALLCTVGPSHAARNGLRLSRRANRTLGNDTYVNGSQEIINQELVDGSSSFDVNDPDANDSPLLEVAADQALRTALLAAGGHQSETMEGDSKSGLRGSSQQGGGGSQGIPKSVNSSSSHQSMNSSGIPQGSKDAQPHLIQNIEALRDKFGQEDENPDAFEGDAEELLAQFEQMVNRVKAKTGPQGVHPKSKDPKHGAERLPLKMSKTDERDSSLPRFPEEELADEDDEDSDEVEQPRPSHHSLKRYKEYPQTSDDDKEDGVDTVILTRVPKRYRMHARGMARASERYLRMAEGIDDAYDDPEEDVVARHAGTIVHARTGDYKVVKLNGRKHTRGKSSPKSKYAKVMSNFRKDVDNILMNLERSQDAGESLSDLRDAGEEEEQEGMPYMEERVPQRRLRTAGRRQRMGLYNKRAEVEQADEAEVEDEQEGADQTGGAREEEAAREEEEEDEQEGADQTGGAREEEGEGSEAQDFGDEELQREREALAKEGFSFEQEQVETDLEASTLDRDSFDWIEAAISDATHDSGLDEVLNASTPEETLTQSNETKDSGFVTTSTPEAIFIASDETGGIEAKHDETSRPISFVQESLDPPPGGRKPADSSEQPINFLQLSSHTERLSDRERRLQAAGKAAKVPQASKSEQKAEAGPSDILAPQPLVSL